MAVETIGEAIGALLGAAIEIVLTVTIGAARLAWKPLRFLCSASFRQETRQRWREQPDSRFWDLAGSSAALLFFAAVVVGWIWVLTPSRSEPAPPPPPLSEKARRSFMEKVRDLREKHRRHPE